MSSTGRWRALFSPGGQRIYYGWILVGIGVLCYGFGISPAYYSWGFFGPELRQDLGLTREQTGSIFGVFVFTFGAVGPLVGLGIARFGIRAMITAGSLVAALGFYLLSQAQSAADCYVAYALIGGIGIGFSCILPNQSLATFWFEKYRARAMALIFTGGALVGMAVNPFNAAILEGGSWRDAWTIIALVSVGVAILALIFVRDTPASMGLRPDGAAATIDERVAVAQDQTRYPWSAREALRTPQFALVTICSITLGVPWGIVSAHGGLYVREEMGISVGVAALILGTLRVGASAIGRLSASAGDFLAPSKVLALAHVVEAAGVACLALANSEGLLYVGVVLLGLGFGAAYISLPVVFGDFFGMKAFALTGGIRIMIAGVFGYLAPRLAGKVADTTGSYVLVFWACVAIALLGATSAFLCRRPTPPSGSPIR